MGGESLISLILWLCVLVVLVYVVNVLLAQLTLPPPIRTVVMLIVALVVLIWLFRQFGLVSLPDLLPLAGAPQGGSSG